MVQTQVRVGAPPMLTAFGRLQGGPSGRWQGSDTIVCSLNVHKAAAGSIMLQESDFEGAEQVSPNHLTVLHGGTRMLFTFQTKSGDDELEEGVDPFVDPLDLPDSTDE
jgi:hypothetical protein